MECLHSGAAQTRLSSNASGRCRHPGSALSSSLLCWPHLTCWGSWQQPATGEILLDRDVSNLYFHLRWILWHIKSLLQQARWNLKPFWHLTYQTVFDAAEKNWRKCTQRSICKFQIKTYSPENISESCSEMWSMDRERSQISVVSQFWELSKQDFPSRWLGPWLNITPA